MHVLKDNEETGCCKRFDPAPWNEKEMNFNNRLFIKDHTISFFHVPLNYGKVMKRDMEKIKKAGATVAEPLMLSDESSPWGSDIYIAVQRKVPGFKTLAIPGTFLTKVFEGPYKNMGRWIREMKTFIEGRGKTMKKLYFFYPTCPACAKAYGKNYIVLVAQV